MKILHISSAKTWRGGEQQIYYLVQGSQDKVTHFVFTPEHSPLAEKLLPQDAEIITYPKLGTLSLTRARQVTKICKDNAIDLIHIHDSHGHNYVWLSYSVLGLSVPSVLSRRVDYAISRLSIPKYNHSGIKKILCVSNAIKEIMLKSIQDKDKVTTVYSGVKRTRNERGSTFFRDMYAVLEYQLLIGNIAAISEQKDYTTFVHTAVRFEERNPSRAIFLIIGQDGGEKKMIEDLIKRKKADKYIKVTGFIENVKNRIHELDCLLFTSKNEGLGTTVLDAMNQSVPVVATKTGGIPEIITHNKSGLLADVGDSTFLCTLLERVTSDKAVAKRLISHGKAMASRFSEREMIRKTLKIYNEIIENQ